MCTVSWIRQPDGYELFCNRDESRARKPALPPQVLDLHNAKTIAPRDGNFGGSWISVNEFGLALSLLNFHSVSPKSGSQFTSRGLLLMELANCRSREKVLERIAEARLEKFQPFTLLALTPDEAALIVRWDGGECLIDCDAEARMPLTSSSFDSGKVIESRKQHFQSLADSVGIDSNFLLDFHRNHDPAPSAYSTCMHRADAETVSFSRIKVDSNSVAFRYHPHSPCRDGVAEVVEIRRKKWPDDYGVQSTGFSRNICSVVSSG